MKILQELTKQPDFFQKDDMSLIPEDIMREINKIILKGAKDKEQKWANALELVHSAYDQTGTPYPSPDEKSAWKQYEENIANAVKQLAKARGLHGDWRMSSSVFHESISTKTTFHVKHIEGKRVSETVAHDARNINELAEIIRVEDKRVGIEVKIKHIRPKNIYHITIWKHNTKLPGYFEVTPTITA